MGLVLTGTYGAAWTSPWPRERRGVRLEQGDEVPPLPGTEGPRLRARRPCPGPIRRVGVIRRGRWGSRRGARRGRGRRRRRPVVMVATGREIPASALGGSRRLLPALAPRRRRPSAPARRVDDAARATATRWRWSPSAWTRRTAMRSTPWSWRCPNRNRPPTRTLDHRAARNRTSRGRRRGGLSRTPHSLWG